MIPIPFFFTHISGYYCLKSVLSIIFLNCRIICRLNLRKHFYSYRLLQKSIIPIYKKNYVCNRDVNEDVNILYLVCRIKNAKIHLFLWQPFKSHDNLMRSIVESVQLVFQTRCVSSPPTNFEEKSIGTEQPLFQ